MPELLRCVPHGTVITGWDFSTSGVKCLAFDLEGRTLASVHLDTDLWFGLPPQPGQTAEGPRPRELNLMQLEGQARASTRAIAQRLREAGAAHLWAAGGISATHHTAGRIDADGNPVRRAICWNDPTLPHYHAAGLARLAPNAQVGGAQAGEARVRELIGGPWAPRYSLSHLLKDESDLTRADWRRTRRVLSHGSLAAGYLTGNFGTASVSSAASTGIMDLRTNSWRREMLHALADDEYRKLAWRQLPRIVHQYEPLGRLAGHLALEAGVHAGHRPWLFPTSDDQQAGLIGGGAVAPGQLAVLLGKSAVVNSSSGQPPAAGSTLDVMRLNWGPYLWMRCYQNGAQFLDPIVGESPDWPALEQQASACPAGCKGISVMPFSSPETCLGIDREAIEWKSAPGTSAGVPHDPGVRCRAAFEAIAYLIALGVREHEAAGQRVERISVSGGIARSDLMCQILASVLGRDLERLVSDEGCCLGAAATALAALESNLRRQQGIAEPFAVQDAAAAMVKFRREPARPVAAWAATYRDGLAAFEKHLSEMRRK